jgi:hypothetical protein
MLKFIRGTGGTQFSPNRSICFSSLNLLFSFLYTIHQPSPAWLDSFYAGQVPRHGYVSMWNARSQIVDVATRIAHLEVAYQVAGWNQ